MWTDEARQASIAARRNASSGAEPVAAGSAPAAHQSATNAVPANMAASAAAAQATARMAAAGRGGVDRSPPTNYRAPTYVTPASQPSPNIRDYSERGNGGERQNTYTAPRYSDVSAPTRQIADYSDKTADQGRSAQVRDELSARYSQ